MPPETLRAGVEQCTVRLRTSHHILIGQLEEGLMADLYLKALESERKSLWAACRLKGLAKDTPERLRIAQLDVLISEHKQRSGSPS